MHIIPIEAASDMGAHMYSGYCHVGLDRVMRFAMRIGDRDAMERAVEVLIDLMDAMEHDPDLELSGDEADYSYSEASNGDACLDRYCLEDDEPNCDYEPDAEGEPWLGAPDGLIDQTVAWGASAYGWGDGREAG